MTKTNLFSKNLALFLCLVMIFSSVAPRKVEAVAIVDDVLIALVLGALTVGGVYATKSLAKKVINSTTSEERSQLSSVALNAVKTATNTSASNKFHLLKTAALSTALGIVSNVLKRDELINDDGTSSSLSVITPNVTDYITNSLMVSYRKCLKEFNIPLDSEFVNKTLFDCLSWAKNSTLTNFAFVITDFTCTDSSTNTTKVYRAVAYGADDIKISLETYTGNSYKNCYRYVLNSSNTNRSSQMYLVKEDGSCEKASGVFLGYVTNTTVTYATVLEKKIPLTPTDLINVGDESYETVMPNLSTTNNYYTTVVENEIRDKNVIIGNENYVTISEFNKLLNTVAGLKTILNAPSIDLDSVRDFSGTADGYGGTGSDTDTNKPLVPPVTVPDDIVNPDIPDTGDTSTDTTGFFSSFWTNLKELFTWLGNVITTGCNTLKNGFASIINSATTTLVSSINKVTIGVSSSIDDAILSISTVINNTTAGISETINNVTVGISAILTDIKTSIDGVTSGISTALSNTATDIETSIAGVTSGISAILTDIATDIETSIAGVSTTLNDVSSNIKTAIYNVNTSLSSLMNSISTNIIKSTDRVIAKITSLITLTNRVATNIETSIAGVTSGISTALSNTATDIKTALNDVVLGVSTVINNTTAGITSSIDKVVAGVTALTASVTAFFDTFWEFNVDLSVLKVSSAKLITIFPFCLPWDIVNAISLLICAPTPPIFTFNLFPGLKSLNVSESDSTITLDFTEFDNYFKIARQFEIIIFIVILAMLTRNIIRS